MKIALFHTAQVHVDTFEALIKAANPDAECHHHVAPDLLAHAQAVGLSSVAQDTTEILVELSQADAVLCTCSTLGPLADTLAKQRANIIRVDRPLMEAATTYGSNVMIVICLESTRDASLSLLEDCAELAGTPIMPNLVLCDTAWPFFERGDTRGFAVQIAASIRAAIDQSGRPDCIVLAQASMRVATDDLTDLDVPILSSPALAVQRLLQIATSTSGVYTN